MSGGARVHNERPDARGRSGTLGSLCHDRVTRRNVKLVRTDADVQSVSLAVPVRLF